LIAVGSSRASLDLSETPDQGVRLAAQIDATLVTVDVFNTDDDVSNPIGPTSDAGLKSLDQMRALFGVKRAVMYHKSYPHGWPPSWRECVAATHV
jgi:hypothetical protein